MPRIARVIATNYPHHVTQRGNNRVDVFFDNEDKAFYLKTLRNYSQKYKVDIWVYCLMPNHLHLLAVPKDSESLARCLGRTNLIYTQHVNRKYKRSGRLWQNRFFSTLVEKDPYLWVVARYIENNPVKSRLTKKPEDYKWSSCRANMSGQGDELVRSHGWLEAKDRRGYKTFLGKQDPGIEERIRRATSTGRPLGSERFIKKLERKLFRQFMLKKAGRPKKQK